MVSCDKRMLLSSGYCVFSHPEIYSGDQSNTSLPATISLNLRFLASRHLFARSADFQACLRPYSADETGGVPLSMKV